MPLVESINWTKSHLISIYPVFSTPICNKYVCIGLDICCPSLCLSACLSHEGTLYRNYKSVQIVKMTVFDGRPRIRLLVIKRPRNHHGIASMRDVQNRPTRKMRIICDFSDFLLNGSISGTLEYVDMGR